MMDRRESIGQMSEMNSANGEGGCHTPETRIGGAGPHISSGAGLKKAAEATWVSTKMADEISQV